MGIIDRLFGKKPTLPASAPTQTGTLQPGERPAGGSERGSRVQPDDQIKRLYRQFYVDMDLRQTIIDIRTMDRLDGRVKSIHRRTSRAAAKGGIKLVAPGAPKWLQAEFDSFCKALHLDRRDKLESDIRGLMMEGNLPMQWVLNAQQSGVVSCARMPAETIVPLVGPSGLFDDPAKAYVQRDLYQSKDLATFGLWQLTVARLTPDNYDDFGSLGRPYLDATRAVWRKLVATEEDLVIRRRMRAPLRMVHVLEGAPKEDMDDYRLGVERDQAAGNYRDYYLNRKGAVTAVQGDAKLSEIADVELLMDSFFAGSPAPKGLFGYAKDLQRDILDDLKADFFDELDALQDNTSWTYQQGFRLHLLLRGRNPDAFEFNVEFAERRTDTPNQRADHALKLQALGLPEQVVWEAAGIDVAAAERAREEQVKKTGVYPGGEGGDAPGGDPANAPPSKTVRPRVNVTPGNGRKGESATTVSTAN